MKRLIPLVLLVTILYSNNALANEARTNLPWAPGVTILNFYYNHGFGNELYSKNNKISDSMNFTSNVSMFHPIYNTEIGGVTCSFHAFIPFGEVELNGVRSGGIGDIIPFAQVWLLNMPENKFFLVWAPYVTLPTGQYRPENSINLGDNRWSTKQELAFVKGFGENTWLEWLVNVEFFSDNTNVSETVTSTDAYNNTITSTHKVTSSKDPVFGSQVHLSYTFTPVFWASLDYYFTYGGEHTIAGTRQNDRTVSHVVGPEAFFAFDQHTNVMVGYEYPLAVQNGIKSSKVWVRLAYNF
jgi:hypothetical protein